MSYEQWAENSRPMACRSSQAVHAANALQSIGGLRIALARGTGLDIDFAVQIVPIGCLGIPKDSSRMSCGFQPDFAMGATAPSSCCEL
jgi:hypothetical protein